MRLLPLALLLAAGPATGADPAPVVPVRDAAAPVTAPPPMAGAPAATAAAPATPPPAPAPAVEPPPPSGLAARPPSPSVPAGSADSALPRAVAEKLAQGDRAFQERDYRGALFAYMDATYLAPASAVPRVRLGRAYLAMRYPERALDQAEKALALDPASAEARRLGDEARGGVRTAAPPRAPASGAAAPSAARPAPRVFKYVPEPEGGATPVPSRAASPARSSAPAAPLPVPVPVPGAGAGAGGAAEGAGVAAAAAGVARSAASATPPTPSGSTETSASAAQRYREGIDLLQKREFEKALVALDDAVAKDPRLAVAHAARASARFGLGRYRDAADSYRTAMSLDAKLGTPLYGLAECHRVLGDTKAAADMYRRYAESTASDVREDLRAMAAKRAQELK